MGAVIAKQRRSKSLADSRDANQNSNYTSPTNPPHSQTETTWGDLAGSDTPRDDGQISVAMKKLTVISSRSGTLHLDDLTTLPDPNSQLAWRHPPFFNLNKYKVAEDENECPKCMALK